MIGSRPATATTNRNHKGFKERPFGVLHQQSRQNSLRKSYLESDRCRFGNPVCQHGLEFTHKSLCGKLDDHFTTIGCWAVIRRLLHVIVTGFIIAGCATYPDQSNIERFAAASQNAASVVEDVYSEHLNAVVAINTEENAERYLRNAAGVVLAPEITFVDDVDATNDEFLALSRQAWEVRIRAIQALVEYSAALKAYADPADVQRLEGNVSRIASAIGGLAAVGGVPQAALISPIGNIAAGAVGLVSAQGRAVQLRNAMAVAQEPLERTAELLKIDIAVMITIVETEIRILEGWVINNMRTIHADHRVSTLERYELFERKSAELAVYKARLAYLKSYGGILEKMVRTHRALAKSEDTQRALDDFLKTVNLLTDTLKLNQ